MRFNSCRSLVTSIVSTCVVVVSASGEQTQESLVTSEVAVFEIEVVAEGLEIPWTMAILPDGTALVGKREAGRLHRLDLTTGSIFPIDGLPALYFLIRYILIQHLQVLVDFQY